MTELYKEALRREKKTQQEIATKFKVTRSMVNIVVNKPGESKGYFGKSKLIKDYLEKLVKKHKLKRG